MINKFPTKIIVVSTAALLLLWLLLSGSSSNELSADSPDINSSDGDESVIVSAIRPISNADADSSHSGVIEGEINRRRVPRELNPKAHENLTSRFEQANAAINKGQFDFAVNSLEALTADYPTIVEPYLNLASVYAEQQELEKAREVLLQGFAANPKAGMLFDHLKKVHGALAADSYRQALDTNSPRLAKPRLRLARASDIVTQQDQTERIAALERQVQNQQQNVTASENQTTNLALTQASIAELEASHAKAVSTYEDQIASLRKRLAETSQALSRSQINEREAQARVVRAEQDALDKVAEITRELELQKTSLLAAQTVAEEQSTALENAQRMRQLARQQASRNNAPESNTSTGDTASSQNLEQIAVGLANSWARDWSAQDVSAYISHYADDYTSSRTLSRSQWLAQRQVRLTNKAFINVKLSNFKVKDLGNQFTVTFSQYYQSNTVDDTVTKRLTYMKNGNDLRQSKIISERLVSN